MRAHCLPIAVGIALFVACGSSPSAPTRNEIEVAGAVIWTDPQRAQFVVSRDAGLWRLATVTPATRFFGDVTTAATFFSAFQTGSRLQVTVVGAPTEAGEWNNPGVLASSVTSERRTVALTWVGWSPERPLMHYEPRVTAVVWYHNIVIVRPWTIFDPTGDITTYESFLAAASTGELVTSTSADGDGWLTGFYEFEARSLKVIRTSKKSSSGSGVPADARGWAIHLRRPFQ